MQYYSFDEVIVTVAGVEIREFAADGSGISIDMAEDQFTPSVGIDGNVVVNKNLNAMGMFEINLIQTSESNPVLSAILTAAYNGVYSTFPVLVKDLNGNSLYTGAKCWLRRYPKSDFGKEVSTRTWTIDTSKMIPFIGGSEDV